MFVNNIIISYRDLGFIVDASKGSICEIGDMGMYRDGLYCLFSKSGFSKRLHDAAEDEDVLVHSISCLPSYCD